MSSDLPPQVYQVLDRLDRGVSLFGLPGWCQSRAGDPPPLEQEWLDLAIERGLVQLTAVDPDCLAAGVYPELTRAGSVALRLSRTEQQKRPPSRANSIEAMLGREGEKKLEIVRCTELTSDEKMRAIHKIDPTAAAWDSPRWAEVLGVSDAAIRKNPFWKELKRKEAD